MADGSEAGEGAGEELLELAQPSTSSQASGSGGQNPGPAAEAELVSSSGAGQKAERGSTSANGKAAGGGLRRCVACCGRPAPAARAGPAGGGAASERGGGDPPSNVVEQRVSGLAQSLACGMGLAITPALKQIPSAVLWGFFDFMACEGLAGSQLWDRTMLLLTDPKRIAQEASP